MFAPIFQAVRSEWISSTHIRQHLQMSQCQCNLPFKIIVKPDLGQFLLLFSKEGRTL